MIDAAKMLVLCREREKKLKTKKKIVKRLRRRLVSVCIVIDS